MYEAFTGEIVRRDPTEVVVDVNGVAYRFTVPLSTSQRLPAEGPVRLLAHLVVRDDRHELVGFVTDLERVLFRHLISVNGIGPAVALQVLSRASIPDFVHAVRNEDRAYLNSIKGVGRKTVDRILVELAEPMRKWDLTPTATRQEDPASMESPLRQEAVKALGTLGLSAAAARRAVERAERKLEPGVTLEELVKTALTIA